MRRVHRMDIMVFIKQRRVLAWIACIEAGLLIIQAFLFYPCLTNNVPSVALRSNDVQSVALHPEDVVGNSPDDVEESVLRPEPKIEAPINTPENIRERAKTGIPPPRNLPKNSPKYNYKPNWESLESRPLPEWYGDAKIGIFIHWGVYSVPGFVKVGTGGLSEWFWHNWKGKHPRKAAHESTIKFMQENYPPNWQYSDFAPQFTAEFYNPEHWADLFAKSGAKYVVLTSKHHDGFTLWGSKRSWNWNAVDNGPHRDILGDLVKAIRTKTDLHFGAYHSLYEWFNPTYLDDKKNGYRTQNFVTSKLIPEIMDLVNTYQPEVLWSDGAWDAPCSYWNCTGILTWLYNESPVRDIVVTNDRWGMETSCKHGGFLSCDDRYIPKVKVSRKWENCMTIDKESWGYRRNAHSIDYYNMDELTELLARTISYGGNLLMNVGPTADGRISPIFEERLLELGKWLKVNGEAVYTTREWIYPQDSSNKNIYYTRAKDNSAIYAFVLDWPEDNKLSLGSPKPSKTTAVTWLGYEGTIGWQAGDPAGMTIELPLISLSKIPCLYAWVFKITGVENMSEN